MGWEWMKNRLKGFFILLIFLLLVNGCQVGGKDQKPQESYTDPIIPSEEQEKSNKDGEEVSNDNEEEKSHNKEDNQAKARLIFLGDNMMDGNVAQAMKAKGDQYPLSEFMPTLDKADLVIANLETAVGTSGNTLAKEKKYAFQTHPDRLTLFEPLRKRLVFSLANNHGMDAPLDETMTELDAAGYQYIGVGKNIDAAIKPYNGEINGVSFAVIASSRVIPFSSWAAGPSSPGMASAYVDQPLLNTVKEWNAKVDYVIVYLHWGEELSDTPNKVQRDLEAKLLSAGAHIIIGSHPHVLQGMTWHDQKRFTAYSLGNFVFTTSSNAKANDTLALELTLSKEKIEEVQLWPGQIKFGLVRFLQAEDEKGRVLSRIRALSPHINVDSYGRITNLK
jgi:poly-gamma-glutamate capsule biosynthesis protein CapA/YwtB (metallophosphatase superfamily)